MGGFPSNSLPRLRILAMPLALTIAVCALIAVFGATGRHFLLSKLTARTDDVAQVEYSALRSFLQRAANRRNAT